MTREGESGELHSDTGGGSGGGGDDGDGDGDGDEIS